MYVLVSYEKYHIAMTLRNFEDVFYFNWKIANYLIVFFFFEIKKKYKVVFYKLLMIKN